MKLYELEMGGSNVAIQNKTILLGAYKPKLHNLNYGNKGQNFPANPTILKNYEIRVMETTGLYKIIFHLLFS